MSNVAASTFSFTNLQRAYEQAPRRNFTAHDKYVVFSDLHLGAGGATDDFKSNSEMFHRVLADYYLSRGYRLILNGDVEELQRYSLADIQKQWAQTYEIFDAFRDQTELYRIIGNHDLPLLSIEGQSEDIHEALCLTYQGNDIFIVHGHQTSKHYESYSTLIELSLKYLANPLRIKNYSVSHSSKKRFKAEQRVYEFASSMKLVAVVGHTHRPLFESLSKTDAIKFRIENLCRRYIEASEEAKPDIELEIQNLRDELHRVLETGRSQGTTASLYNANLVVPCVFNSGCVIGKRGMTCLEIDDGNLTLAHWFDENRSRRYIEYESYHAEKLDDSNFYRVVINRDSLEYIFTRITLLA
jgi:predicted phosphodiesterase